MAKRAPKSTGKSVSTKPAARTAARAATVGARPPSVEPAPAVIDLLRRVNNWRSETPAERDRVLTSVQMVLGAWDTRGDLDELRALLGVKPGRKRKKAP